MTLRELIGTLPRGLDTPILGEPWLTDDGAVLCVGGTAWCLWRYGWEDDPAYPVDDPIRVSPCRIGSDPESPEPRLQINDCQDSCVEVISKWSTRERAEAALAAMKGKP